MSDGSQVLTQQQAQKKSFTQSFGERFKSLSTQERRQDFDATRYDDVKKYYEDLAHRTELKTGMAMSQPSQAVFGMFAPNIDYAPYKAEELKTPEMGAKASAGKSLSLKKSKWKKGSHSPNATEYTDFILSRKGAYIPGQYDDYLEFTKEGDAYGKLDAALKKNWNPDMFEPEYFAENFEYVSAQLHELENFNHHYFEDKASYSNLDTVARIHVAELHERYLLIKDCYEKALACHGLKIEDGALVEKTDDNSTAEDDLDAAGLALSERLNNYRDNLVESARRDVRSETAHQAQGTREYYQSQIWDRMDQEMPDIKARFTEELTYMFIKKVFEFMDSPAGQELPAQDQKAVEGILADYINVKEYYDDLVIQKNAIYNQYLLSIGSEPVKGAADTPEIQAHFDELMRIHQEAVEKMNIYGVIAGTMASALAFVVEGEQKYGSDSIRLLAQYGYTPAVEKLTKEVDACKQYADVDRKKGDALIAAIKRNLPSEEDAEDGEIHSNLIMEFAFSEARQRFGVNLASLEDEEYNDALVELFVARYEEKETVGVDDAIENRVAVAGEAVLEPKVKAIMDTDYKEFVGLTGEALVAKLPVLMELTMGIGMIEQLANNPSDISDMTLLEKILGKPPLALNDVDPEGFVEMNLAYSYKRSEFNSKIAFFNGLMIMARGTSFLADGVGEDGNLAQYLTHDEKMERSPDPANDVDPDDSQVLLYARQMIEFGNQRMQTGLMFLNQIDSYKQMFNYQDGKK